jgi:hypothetical protein
MSTSKAERQKRWWKQFWRFMDQKIANLEANGNPRKAEEERRRWSDVTKRPWLKGRADV